MGDWDPGSQCNKVGLDSEDDADFAYLTKLFNGEKVTEFCETEFHEQRNIMPEPVNVWQCTY